MSVSFKVESGVQLLARLTKKPKVEKFYPALFNCGPTSGDIIELISDICTSHLLIDIVSEALIETKLNGEAAGILIFNTDGNMNFGELINVIKRKLWNRTNSTHRDDVLFYKTVHDTLANLHILNIYDVTQFYTTIYHLETTLIQHPNISIIIFDTLTAFYWSEQGFKITKMDLYTKNLINTIQKVTKQYKTICIYTRPGYFCSNKEPENIPMELNCQIQLLENDKGFKVNIKTSSTRTTKFYTASDGHLKWTEF